MNAQVIIKVGKRAQTATKRPASRVIHSASNQVRTLRVGRSLPQPPQDKSESVIVASIALQSTNAPRSGAETVELIL